jgi:uncharacterized protein with ParB-like and HNH nuclease domain
MYQTGGTIETLLNKVEQHEYILPAIQREFVWRPDQICQLFDSLLQGYPFGTFLFWKIKTENLRQYQFYDFMRDYHQRDQVHCKKLDIIGENDRIAVLDGQQRMTALNIGLRGSYSWKTQGNGGQVQTPLSNVDSISTFLNAQTLTAELVMSSSS